jgi:4'-phosphopantetheinyl transferase EntD
MPADGIMPVRAGNATLLGQIVPALVACAEAFADAPDARLFPAEEALIAKALDKRRREFTTARCCARRAIGELGFAPAPILPGARGAPQWPSGVVGSITHCAGYRAAAVARARDMLTIGIDAEPDEALPEGVLELISLPGERARLHDLAAGTPGTCWDRLLFSAKESVYKAWFPLARRWLGFQDADLTIRPAEGVFEVRLLVEPPGFPCAPPPVLTGRFLARDGLVLTAVTSQAARAAQVGRIPEAVTPAP